MNRFALIGTHLIEADTMLCAAATPATAPPPLPPSPPSPPGPPSPSPAGRPAMLTQIQVETLSLNQPYSPMPFVAYKGQGGGAASSGNQPDGDGPRYNGDGKLHVELEYEYLLRTIHPHIIHSTTIQTGTVYNQLQIGNSGVLTEQVQ